MSKRMVVALKLGAIVAVVLIALIAGLFVLDVIEGAAARDALTKTILVVAIFTLASLALLFLSGPSQEGPARPEGE
jgi:hypothetical protein